MQHSCPRPVVPSNDRHPRTDFSHCLHWHDKDVEQALFRMHESESWGQVHQSVKEGVGRRQDGWMEMEGRWSKERSTANGFMATVIIRPAENHSISHGAEGMQVDADRCFSAWMQACGREFGASWTVCDLLRGNSGRLKTPLGEFTLKTCSIHAKYAASSRVGDSAEAWKAFPEMAPAQLGLPLQWLCPEVNGGTGKSSAWIDSFRLLSCVDLNAAAAH